MDARGKNAKFQVNILKTKKVLNFKKKIVDYIGICFVIT